MKSFIKLMTWLFISLFMFSSCNSNETKLDEAVDDICNCIDEMEDELSPESKKIFIQAAKSDDPQSSIQEQLMKLEQEEQEKIAMEFKGLDNSKANECFKNLEKKYPELENATKETQMTVLEKAEDECSEFAAALLKVSEMFSDMNR